MYRCCLVLVIGNQAINIYRINLKFVFYTTNVRSENFTFFFIKNMISYPERISLLYMVRDVHDLINYEGFFTYQIPILVDAP